MRAVRIALATVVGALVFTGAVVYVGGVLAALPVPRSYFSLFGREHQALALVPMNVFTWAVPVAAGVFLCTRGYMFGVKSNAKAVAIGLFIGMFAAFVYWQWPAQPGSVMQQVSAVLEVALAPFTPQSWLSLPNAVAPWLGLWLALSSVRRSGAEA